MKFSLKAIKKQLSLKLDPMNEDQIYGDDISIEQILEQVSLLNNHLVLDMGAGYGYLAQAIAPHVESVIAVDINPEMIEEGIKISKYKSIENIKYAYSDAEKLEFENHSFDYVFCYFSAHHFTNLTKALSEAYRVLKIGGKFVLMDYAIPEEEKFIEFANKIETLRDPGHVCFNTLERWQKLLSLQGFKIINTESRQQLVDFDRWSDGARTPEFIKNHLRQVLLNCDEQLKQHFKISENQSKVSFEYREILTIAEK